MSNNRRKTNTSTEEQIAELTTQLQRITIQLAELQNQVRQEREQAVAEVVSRNNDCTRLFQIGDLVRITNNYQNLRGTEGRVIKISTSFVTIRTADGRQIVRGTQNIEIIFED